MDYWDTSTLAKLYFGEPDSAAFVTHLSTNGPAVASELASWEMFRVAARKEAEGFIGANTRGICLQPVSSGCSHWKSDVNPDG